MSQVETNNSNGKDRAIKVAEWFAETRSYFFRPFEVLKSIRTNQLRFDLLSGLTVAVVMLPQAMAYALIAELPPQMGIYSAIVASVIAILWGSSKFLHTGPTNAASLLVLSTLMVVAVPGSPEYIAAAGVMAIMVGIIRLLMGIARMGVLVNFVADSVVVGFTAGAGILIAVNQVPHLINVQVESSPLFFSTLYEVIQTTESVHWPTFAIGGGVVVTMLLLKWLLPKWPDGLIAIVIASLVVGIFSLDQQGIRVLGRMPQELPPISRLPLNFFLIRDLVTGSLAIAVIGLVEAMSISRSIANKSGERIDANQEFVGQGIANIFAGLFSGYTCSGSFTRTAVNYSAGARSVMSVILASVFVVGIMFFFAPMANYIPRAALAGLLVVIGIRLVDRKRITKVWRISKWDTTIMIATLAATLLFPLEFAVLTGVLISFARQLIETSKPQVQQLLPDEDYQEFSHHPEKQTCPQLGILTVRGSLYFGATGHVEDTIREHMEAYPEQRYLLLHMQQVNRCDVSGLRMLESLVDLIRDKNGDLFLTGVHQAVWSKMRRSGFDLKLGHDHFLTESRAVEKLFYKVLDPAICIYSCPNKVWAECQTLPKSDRLLQIEIPSGPVLPHPVKQIKPDDIWSRFSNGEETQPVLVDVREPVEYEQGHIPNAKLIPMPDLLSDSPSVPDADEIVFVCRSGRRSQKVISYLERKGYKNLALIEGGMLGWRDAGLPQVID